MKLFALFFFLLLLIVSHLPAFADEKVSTEITMVFTGHRADLFGIHTMAPTVNPAQCKLSDSGYATDSHEPGFQTLYAAVLLAFAERANVEVIVDDEGCVADRPRMIGLNILR